MLSNLKAIKATLSNRKDESDAEILKVLEGLEEKEKSKSEAAIPTPKRLERIEDDLRKNRNCECHHERQISGWRDQIEVIQEKNQICGRNH